MLRIEHLRVEASGHALLDDLCFEVADGESVAVVGASGAGKSTFALALLRLLRPPLRQIRGAVWLGGRDLHALKAAEFHRCRGRDLFMVFQSAGALLDPVVRVGNQLGLVAQRGGQPATAIAPILSAVGLAPVVLQQHAHELSGGMKQRVLIAMALLLRARVLVADEPTSGLDDQTAHEVLDALLAAQQRLGSALVLVTHDLRLVRRCSSRVLVLDDGRLVEDAAWPSFQAGPRSAAGAALLQAAEFLDRRP